MVHDCIEETDYGEGVNLVQTEKLFMDADRVLNMKKPKDKVKSNVEPSKRLKHLKFSMKKRSKSFKPRVASLIKSFKIEAVAAPSNENLLHKMQ